MITFDDGKAPAKEKGVTWSHTVSGPGTTGVLCYPRPFTYNGKKARKVRGLGIWQVIIKR